MTHSARATPALRALVEADPALAALALWCAHRDGERTETAGDTITYGPEFAGLPLHHQTGLAAHHVLHAALRHSARLSAMAERLGDRFDADLWGIAADAIINEALLLSDHALPRPALRLTELLAETLGPAPSPREALAAWDADRLYLALANADGDGRTARAAKAHAAAQGHGPDLRPAPAQGPDPKAGDDAAWRQHLSRAMEAGRIAGRGIGRLAGTLADLPSPRIPWEIVLRGLLARALLPLPQPTWTRPARSWLAMDAQAQARNTPTPGLRPGTRRDTPASRIAVGLDTSSSIGPETARLFLAELTGIARRSGAEVHLIPFDETPEPPVRLDPLAPALPQRPHRQGGGTDFRPLVAAAAGLHPSALVVLTDLDGPTGPAPKLPVIWATPGPATPPFGRHLDLSA
jgi:predicted metal-dependent peptidase